MLKLLIIGVSQHMPQQRFLIRLYRHFLLHKLGPSYVYTWFILKMPGELASNRVRRHAL